MVAPSVRNIILQQWTPRNLGSALALWIEPRRGGLLQAIAGTTPAVATNDPVGYLPDFSGKNFILTGVADDGTRPTLGGVGSLPYLNFDGTSQLLRNATDIGTYAAGAHAVFAAIRSSTPSTSRYLYSQFHSSVANTIFAPIVSNSATSTSASSFYRNDAGSTILNITTALQANAFDNADRVYGIVDNGAEVIPYLDASVGSPTSYTRSGALTPSTTCIGGGFRAAAIASTYWPGRVYGLIVLHRVPTGSEIQKIRTYMGKLAGLSL
jgi:hypothetical protein